MSRPDTHDARVRWAIELGARSRATPALGMAGWLAALTGRSDAADARRQLLALRHGDVADRWLGLVAAHGDRDSAALLAALDDASRRVRGKALVTLAVVGDDAAVAEGLERAWRMRCAKPLLRRLMLRRRRAPVDAYLDFLRAENAVRDLVDACALGTEAGLRRHLELALGRPSATFWRRLASHHPVVLCETLCARWARQAGEADAVTRQLTDRYLLDASRRTPDAALDVVDALLAHGVQPASDVQRALARRRPAAMLARAADHNLPVVYVPPAAAARVPAAQLATVIVEAPHRVADWERVLRLLPRSEATLVAEAWSEAAARGAAQPRLLTATAPYLSPSARLDAWPAWSIAMRDSEGVVSPNAVDLLPAGLRALEARRHATEVVALEPFPERQHHRYARHLPWDEALARTADLRGHPDGALRTVALVELLSLPVAQHDASRVPDTLALVEARQFEQDPVRASMFGALSTWPATFWDDDARDALGRILRHALDAADLSDRTAQLAEALVVAQLAVAPAWAAEWLPVLIKERGRIYNARLGQALDDQSVQLAAPALLRIAQAWTRRDRQFWLVQLAQSLGPHLASVHGLPELLAGARSSPHGWVVVEITAMLAQHAPTLHRATFAALLRTLRGRHDDWIASLAQRDVVTWEPCLEEAVVDIARRACRLAKGPTVRDHDLRAALGALRRRARSAFARELPALVEADPSLVVIDQVWRFIHRHRTDLVDRYLSGEPIKGRFATGRTVWLVPATDGFHRWTARQNTLFAAQLAAVAADRERDTPAVLTALGRLPAVVYAPMDALIGFADDERAAVRERAIRVLARCDAGQGLPTLIACLGDARARFALYGLRRAVLTMPPERATPVVAAAPMHKVTLAKEVVRLLGDLRCDAAYAELLGRASTGLHRDVRIAVLRALWDHLHRDPTWAVLEAAVADDDWVLAARVGDVPADRLTPETDRRLSALLARLLARPEAAARLDLLRRAAHLAVEDREGDLLAAVRARLSSRYDVEVCAATQALLARQQEAHAEALGASWRALREDPRALHVASDVLAATLRSGPRRESWRRAAAAAEAAVADDPRFTSLVIQLAAVWRDPADLADRLIELGALDRLGHDGLAAAQAAVSTGGPWSEATLRALAGASPGCRRVALWVLLGRVGEVGWTEVHLQLLATLRDDPDPGVAGAAWRIAPPREDDPA